MTEMSLFFKNTVFLAQLQQPAVTKVEIQSTKLVQFLKGKGLKFCVIHFFFKKKTESNVLEVKFEKTVIPIQNFEFKCVQTTDCTCASWHVGG